MWRERQKLRQGKVSESSEQYRFDASSLCLDEYSAQEIAEMIRGHWGACENGSHYRRDVSLGEGASLVRQAAHAMAVVRNLVLGLFELEKDQGKTNAASVPGWQRRLSASGAIRLIKKGG